MKAILSCTLVIGIYIFTCINLWAYSGGDGTPGNPYLISSKADLLELSGTSGDRGKSFKMTTDIDLAGESFNNSVINGTFSGQFDGSSHVISNLSISATSDYVGLFGSLYKADIYNLGVVDCDISGGYYVGAICGKSEESVQITGCYSSGNISGKHYVGGLCGLNYLDNEISSCYATGDISGTNYVGGVCGQNDDRSEISSCYATGDISGNDYVGGVCGQNNNHSSIQSCYATGNVSGNDYVGGVCGQNNEYSSIQSCYATGNVSGNDYLGGFCGANALNSVVFSCYSVGSVSGHLFLAGFCGQNDSLIDNCYSVGPIKSSSSFGSLGGLCAWNDGYVTNSFWDTDTSGFTASSGGIGKTTTEMQTQSTFTSAGWDFSSIWEMNGYPKLQGQTVEEYELSITNGTGNGSYSDLTLVNINYNPPAPYHSFTCWIVDPAIYSNNIADATAASTTFTMPATNVTLTGCYKLYSGGDGTAGSPYLISDKTDLLMLAARTNDFDKCFKMTSDIDLDGETFTSAVVAPDLDPFDPPYDFQGTSFSGVFDGSGHVVSNLTITGTSSYVGLFGRIDNAVISSLGIANCDISGDYHVGGLYGECGTAVINKCYSTGNIDGNLFVGGLSGHNELETISDCYTMGIVSGKMCVGGFTGITGTGTISRCYSDADIYCSDNWVGGFCGNSSANIINCYFSGSISCGGIKGGMCADNHGSFTASFWDTDTSGISTSDGGIGKTTSEMKTQSTFTSAGWNFDSVWLMSGYPQFQWVAADNAYASWANYWGIPDNDRDYEQDPAGDQIPNLLKYAIGLDPMSVCCSSNVMQLFAYTNNIYIIYHKSKQAEFVELYPEQTDNLLTNNWESTGFDIEKIEETSSNETWKAELLTTNDCSYIRLEAESPGQN